MAYRPVTVRRGAFRFCRWSMAVLMWVALLLHSRDLVATGAIILGMNALVTVRFAPLILLYTGTVERIVPSAPEVLDERATRLAHAVGALALCTCLALLLLRPDTHAGWRLLFWIALAKTAGALGFCAVSKAFGCLTGGDNCCGLFARKPCD